MNQAAFFELKDKKIATRINKIVALQQEIGWRERRVK